MLLVSTRVKIKIKILSVCVEFRFPESLSGCSEKLLKLEEIRNISPHFEMRKLNQ